MRRLRPGVLIAFLLLCAPALGQEAAGAKKPAGGAVTITADTFVVDQNNSLATFSGHVVVKSSRVDVWAPKVVVHYADGNTSDIRSLDATGGVRLKTAQEDATGDRATYDTRTEILRLAGNVVVTNAAGTLRGPELVVDLKNNLSTFSAARGGRVTGVFRTQ